MAGRLLGLATRRVFRRGYASSDVLRPMSKTLRLPDTPFCRFLLKDSGFSDGEVQALLRRFEGHHKYRALYRCEKAFELLGGIGISHMQAMDILMKPAIAKDIANSDVKPKLKQLLDLGFTQEGMAKILERYPEILCSHSKLDPNIKDLKKIFGGKNRLASALEICPELLFLNVEESIRPCLNVLIEIGFSPKEVFNIVRKNPSILTSESSELRLRIEHAKNHGLFKTSRQFLQSVAKFNFFKLNFTPEGGEGKGEGEGDSVETLDCNQNSNMDSHVRNLDILLKYGIAGDNLQYILKKNPKVLTPTPFRLRRKIEYFQSLGMDTSSRVFVRALSMNWRRGVKTLKKKVEFMEGLGLQKEEVLDLVRKSPDVFTVSCEKMQRTMEFLVSTGGCKPNVVVQCPLLLMRSLEKCLLPRYEVVKYLRSLQGCNLDPQLQTLAILPEKVFLQRYLHNSKCSEDVIKVYYETVSQPESDKIGDVASEDVIKVYHETVSQPESDKIGDVASD